MDSKRGTAPRPFLPARFDQGLKLYCNRAYLPKGRMVLPNRTRVNSTRKSTVTQTITL